MSDAKELADLLQHHFDLMKLDRENGDDLLWTDEHEDLYHATEAALRSPSPSVPEREAIARALYDLNPGWSSRQFGGPEPTNWCYPSSKKDLAYRQADAILTLAHPDKRAGEPSTLHGMIAAIYSGLDAEDCARVDREWAKWRGLPSTPAEQPQLSERQRKLDASVTPAQAVEIVRREREALANRDKLHPQPDGFINDYD